MRIFNKKDRLLHSLDTINYFMENEYRYYKTQNIRPFIVDNISYNALYKNLNIQFLITKKCPYNCGFCIEKQNNVGENEINLNLQLKNLEKIIKILLKNKISPTVSITGGEPMIYPKNVIKIKNMIDKFEIPNNLNTAGFVIKRSDISLFSKINLSVHDNNVDINNRIFHSYRDKYWEDEIFQNATIQKTLINNDYKDIKNFIKSFKQKRYSIRFQSRSASCKSLEWKHIFTEIENDKDFVFLQQKIGDYYWYEDYKFKDEKNVRFSFSDLLQIQLYKDKFEKNVNYTRAIIILPNGAIKFDWID